MQNKVTLELKDPAQVYAAEALEVLIEVARNGKSNGARATAATANLDRCHAKPRQQIEAEVTKTLTLQELVLASDQKPAEQAPQL